MSEAARRERIAARTDRVVEGDGATRTRYRGQERRGKPDALESDSADLRHAMTELAAGARALLAAQSAESTTLSIYQRHDLKREALARIALSAAFIEQVLVRHQHDDRRREQPEAEPACDGSQLDLFED